MTLKHVYEIAKVKQTDPWLEMTPLEQVCKQVIGTAHGIGVKVVKDISLEDYNKFREEREKVVEQQKQELQDVREAKMLRTG